MAMPPLKTTFRTGTGKSISDLLEEHGKRAENALAAALFKEAHGIIAQAQQLVPVDTGTLRSSGYVENPVIGEGSIHVEMGFGGAAQGYAIYVHENLEAFHARGMAKFLQLPFNQAQNGMAGRIADDMADNMAGLARDLGEDDDRGTT